MNALIEAKASEVKVLLNPHAIAWAGSIPGAQKVCVCMMTGADEQVSPLWTFDHSYGDFKQAWQVALNYSACFGDVGNGVVAV